MTLNSRSPRPPAPTAADSVLAAGDPGAAAELERPAVLTHGDSRVVFGPGLDDFNAFDDPC